MATLENLIIHKLNLESKNVSLIITIFLKDYNDKPHNGMDKKKNDLHFTCQQTGNN